MHDTIHKCLNVIILAGMLLAIAEFVYADFIIQYENEGPELDWQQSSKHLSPCETFGKMAELVQLTRQETGHEYPEYHNHIELLMPDKKPVYEDNGDVKETGEVRIIERREWQEIGRVVYSQMRESLPANVVGKIVLNQCISNESY